MTTTPWSREEFTERLRALEAGYHIHHPFNRLLTSGELPREAVQAWVLNRFYYQIRIPQKDAALLANCPDRAARRLWVQRILEHDGQGDAEGGIERWLRLGTACGLERTEIESGRSVLPAVRFAVDAYVNFVRTAPWQEAVTSSLTELFAPSIHRERLSAWPARYPWIKADGLDYFRERLDGAHRDSAHGLQVTLDYCDTRAKQLRALEIVEFKLDVLWSLLDAVHLVHVLGVAPRPRQGASLDA